MEFVLPTAASPLGAIIGSFLNVVIHRYPREESIVFPPSHCPHCNPSIRCTTTSRPQLPHAARALPRLPQPRSRSRYPLVELANALFYLAVFQRTGPTVAFLLVAAIVSMTLVLIYIDLEIQILPDVIDLPGVVIGLGAGMRSAARHLDPDLLLARRAARLAVRRAPRRGDSAGRDHRAPTGWCGTPKGWARRREDAGHDRRGHSAGRPVSAVLLIASITGALFGIAAAIASGRSDLRFPIPFGVFLGFAFLITIFFGKDPSSSCQSSASETETMAQGLQAHHSWRAAVFVWPPSCCSAWPLSCSRQRFRRSTSARFFQRDRRAARSRTRVLPN